MIHIARLRGFCRKVSCLVLLLHKKKRRRHWRVTKNGTSGVNHTVWQPFLLQITESKDINGKRTDWTNHTFLGESEKSLVEDLIGAAGLCLRRHGFHGWLEVLVSDELPANLLVNEARVGKLHTLNRRKSDNSFSKKLLPVKQKGSLALIPWLVPHWSVCSQVIVTQSEPTHNEPEEQH